MVRSAVRPHCTCINNPEEWAAVFWESRRVSFFTNHAREAGNHTELFGGMAKGESWNVRFIVFVMSSPYSSAFLFAFAFASYRLISPNKLSFVVEMTRRHSVLLVLCVSPAIVSPTNAIRAANLSTSWNSFMVSIHRPSNTEAACNAIH